MEFEFKVESDHLRRDGPAVDAAVDKYTSSFWPFGRKQKAHKELKKRLNEIIEKHDIEKDEQLNNTFLRVKGVESKEEAQEVIESFKEDLREFYQEELGLDTPPIELSTEN
ncbi:MAG: hypothetical protein V5A81_07350 [Candidatus Bipolaricaulota bacterium]|nr:hypothetical protein [Candidatus Bipolaricaulota bacterium]